MVVSEIASFVRFSGSFVSGIGVWVSTRAVGFMVIFSVGLVGVIALVLFSVVPLVTIPSVAPSVDCEGRMSSLGRSRRTMPTTSCSTSGSSDSKVIWALLGKDMEIFTTVTFYQR